MDDSGGLSLALAFDTDGPEFARGVEVGILWASMDYELHIEQTVHAENAEMVIRMAEVRGWAFAAEALDEHWLQVTLDAGPEAMGDTP